MLCSANIRVNFQDLQNEATNNGVNTAGEMRDLVFRLANEEEAVIQEKYSRKAARLWIAAERRIENHQRSFPNGIGQQPNGHLTFQHLMHQMTMDSLQNQAKHDMKSNQGSFDWKMEIVESQRKHMLIMIRTAYGEKDTDVHYQVQHEKRMIEHDKKMIEIEKSIHVMDRGIWDEVGIIIVATVIAMTVVAVIFKAPPPKIGKFWG